MTGQRDTAVAAVSRLRAALEHTAAALASPRLEALLAGEAAIELALAGLPPIAALSIEERGAVRAELERASRALLRCRRLGTSLGDFVRISLEAQGRGGEYGPRRTPTLSYTGRALDARV